MDEKTKTTIINWFNWWLEGVDEVKVDIQKDVVTFTIKKKEEVK